MLIAVTYHYVRRDYSGCSQGINGVTPSQFETQLALLGRHGRFVSGADLLAAVTEGAKLPERSLLVTFDDGLREQYEEALPILNRMGIPAIFFVNTRPIAEERICTVHKVHLMRALAPLDEFQGALEESARNVGADLDRSADPAKASLQYPYDTPSVAKLKFLINFALPLSERTSLIGATFERLFPGRERKLSRELYMTRSQVSSLMQSGYLGTHGHDHLPMSQLEDEHARNMVSHSIDHLKRWTGARPYALSYPYGIEDTCSPQTAKIAEEHGIRFSFTVETAGNDEESLKNPQFLGRFDCNLLPGGKRSTVSAETMFEHVAAARWHRPVRPREDEFASRFAANG